MLKVVTGRFHPSLESAFVELIQRLKAGDPWMRIAVVIPSKPILDRLRRLLTLDHRLSLLNVHFLTFHQLALRLAANQPHDREGSLRLVDDLFFEHLVGHLATTQPQGTSAALRQLGRSFGTWAALWSTIRDLKDGGVESDTALQALAEGCFGDEDEAWLRALFSLQAILKDVSVGINVGTADDLAEALLPAISHTPFLSSLGHVCYYGFYDLTQVQLSFFQAVASSVPTTLFFPLGNDPAYAFAQRFFDRHLRPLMRAEAAVDLETEYRRTLPEVFIHSVIGSEQELSVTCRAILDLVETHGYRFDEIGVVARTLEPYRTLVDPIFDRHRIPFTTTARRPLIHQPLCKTLLLLAALPVNDFYRPTVLDIVTSPFFIRPELLSGTSAGFRPEQWRAVVEALNITHGREEWKRLERYCQSLLELDGEGDDSGAIGPFKVAPEVTALLWTSVWRLVVSYEALPTHGPFGTLLEAFRGLVKKHMVGSDGDPEHLRVHGPPLTALWEAIDETLNSLDALSLIKHELTWAEFAQVLTHAFERANVASENASSQGVMVIDAMAARGLPFKALFVLGLNEKIFPRYIREDPFLRDRHRRVLETTLGYKIDEKLPAYDEEVLLFTLLTEAAGRRLCLSFQRADESGRMVASSPYVGQVRHRLGIPDQAIDIIPRRMSERLARSPVTSRFLPPAELAQWMAVMGKNPAELLHAVGRDADMFQDGFHALARIEEEHPTLTAFDGITGPLEMHWSRIAERGIAPTPLERYARCPFQYFAADVLKLRPVRAPASDEPDARVLGTFCHGALRRCYELLLPTGWPARPVTDDTIDFCIETAVEEASAEIERQHRTGHYLLWEIAKAHVLEVMTAAVDDDTRSYRETRFAPVAFEVLAEGDLEDVPGPPFPPLKIRGRIDRLDRHQESGALRIIDYKLKIGKSITAEDRQLVQSAVRGYRLQPPLYARFRLPDYGTIREVQLFFLAPHWSNPIARSTFDCAVWSSEAGSMLRNTVRRLITDIQNGRFFILPDSYCDTCEFRVACRREHSPTWWRASRAAESKALAALRTLQVNQ
jgi:ATP-dependent helicase/nuclease subunit B